MRDYLDEMEACVPALRRYARALTHDLDRADDLVQDCLERAIAKRSLFRPRGPMRPWLFTMLLNLHRNAGRTARRRGETVSLDAATFEPSAPPAQHAHLALSELAQAIDNLPNEQREALLLVALEGFSYADAAMVLGIAPGTLVSRISRARAKLREGAGMSDQPHLRTVR